MRHAWTPKFQLSAPTIHSYTVALTCKLGQQRKTFCQKVQWQKEDFRKAQKILSKIRDIPNKVCIVIQYNLILNCIFRIYLIHLQ